MKNKPPKHQPRPFIGVRFNCCGVYCRIFLNKAGTAYAGHCPRCAAPVRIDVAPGGSSSRFWIAD